MLLGRLARFRLNHYKSDECTLSFQSKSMRSDEGRIIGTAKILFYPPNSKRYHIFLGKFSWIHFIESRNI
jgi:hypothetical protein